MKSTSKTIKSLKDGSQFRLSKRSTGTVYELNRKWKNKDKVAVATISSVLSKRSFIKEQTTVVYPV